VVTGPNLLHLLNLWAKPCGLALLAIACQADREAPSDVEGPSGLLELGWSDSTGPIRLSLPARGRWCATDSLLEISGARNDTALGIVLLGTDSGVSGLGIGPYSVVTGRVFIPWRPRALAAFRFAGINTITQYESATGEVTLTDTGTAGLAGRFDLGLLTTGGSDSLRVRGDFRAILVTPAPRPCGRVDKPPPG
jgi:hypothetical protein